MLNVLMWWCSRVTELLGLFSPLLRRDDVRYVLIQWHISCLLQTRKLRFHLTLLRQ